MRGILTRVRSRIGAPASSKASLPTPSARIRWHWWLLLAMLALYSGVWSYISIARMFAFQTQVYDLGIEMAIFWIPYHNQGAWSLANYLNFSLGYGVAYLFWPFTIFPNYSALLILQSILIGAPALVFYAIGRKRLRDPNLALILAGSYLINFEIGGMNWYDFHIESLFPFIFVLGYYFLLEGKYLVAGPLLVLSGLVRVPYMVFPMMLALVVISQSFLRRGDWLDLSSRRPLRFAWILLGVCVAYFLAVEATGLFLVGGTSGTTALVHQGTFFTDFDLKLLTFGLIALPFCFLLPLARWWLLFLTPYGYLVFFVGWFHYYFPYVFTDQYLAIVVPFVYLAAIDAVRVLERVAPEKGRSVATPVPRDRWKTLGLPYRRLGHRGPLVTVVSVVAILVILGLYLLPYGPLNPGSPVDYAFQASITYNSTFYDEYLHLISYVPNSDGYVVFQENLPQLLPRPLPYSQPMSPPNSPFGTNYSVNHYPIWNGLSGRWENAQIDYVVGEPEHTQYYSWGNPSVQTISDQLYSNGYLGMVAEASGMYVLERGYTGTLRYYVPWAEKVPTTSSEFVVDGDGERGPGGTIVGPTGNNATNEMWALYYPFLVPGKYLVTFEMETSSLDPGNNVLIGNPMGKGWLVTSHQFSAVNVWTPISVTVNVTGIYGMNTWAGYSNYWNGTLSLGWMSIQQTAPP